MKFTLVVRDSLDGDVAPARERGLKSFMDNIYIESFCRSREGARIEISTHPCDHKYSKVAPARERGLKCAVLVTATLKFSRSREGARIEILM